MNDKQLTTPRGEIALAVEKEYGQPFWDVVKQYANDGESISSTAVILGYANESALRHHVCNCVAREWFKPASETNGWREARIASRGRKTSRLARMELDKGRALHHATKKVNAFGVLDTVKGHALRHGMNIATVRDRMRRQSMSLENALTMNLVKPGRIHE